MHTTMEIPNSYKAYVVRELNGKYKGEVEEKEMKPLEENQVLIKVLYSSINYKDGLSSIGNKGVTREYPHTPGIDAAGIIIKSQDTKFNPGDKVIVTGQNFGMSLDGGFQEYAIVPSVLPILLPDSLTLEEAMVYGTAGLTAAMSVYKLIQHGIKPEDGSILVTGATGGVGSNCVEILSKLGYTVTAATNKSSEKEKLIQMGATEIIASDEINDTSTRPFLKSQWIAALDTVGGNILSTAIRSLKYGGCVTACGNVAGGEFTTSVYPFILKGITLYGIDSVECPTYYREMIWHKLATDFHAKKTPDVITKINLEALPIHLEKILKGKMVGRTIVVMN